MIIKHMRIDDRLIHGQIVTVWIADSKANTILVADDKAATDSMQKTILKLAVPSGIKLIISTLSEAAEMINNPNKTEEILLIVRNPKSAYELLQRGVHVSELNVGNISNTKSTVGRKKLMQYIFVEPDDADYLIKIAEQGIRLDVRAIPTEKSTNGLELLKNNGF